MPKRLHQDEEEGALLSGMKPERMSNGAPARRHMDAAIGGRKVKVEKLKRMREKGKY